MIFKSTKLVPADQCGVFWVKVFHLYRGGQRKVSHIGNFVKVSVILTKKENWLRRKSKVKGVLVRLKKQSIKHDKSWLLFKKNNVVLLKKRLTPRGKELLGPIDFRVKRKKFMQSFSGIL
jgi:ribosomal protein L14